MAKTSNDELSRKRARLNGDIAAAKDLVANSNADAATKKKFSELARIANESMRPHAGNLNLADQARAIGIQGDLRRELNAAEKKQTWKPGTGPDREDQRRAARLQSLKKASK